MTVLPLPVRLQGTADCRAQLTYTTSNKKVASVDGAGRVTALRYGKATITVTSHNGHKAALALTVKPAPKSVKVQPNSVTLGVGEHLRLRPELNNGAAAGLRYENYDAAVLAVSAEGEITALAPGATQITVRTHNNKTASCAVTVRPAPESVSLRTDNLTLGVGQRLTLVQEDNYQATAGVAALSKEGETVSGDGGNWFRDKDGRLWVVLCDGMGSGRLAAEQSHLALRLLEDFLRAGVSPEIALATLSNALALRGEQEVGFTTIDLVGLDLFSGEGQSYKLGAGPTYLRQSGRVKKLSGTSLPAGLEFGQRAEPDVCSFQLGGEDLAVMVSDGILDGEEDDWIWPLIRDHRDKSPKELAARILERSPGGRDDRTVLVLQLSKRSKAPNRVRAKAAS